MRLPRLILQVRPGITGPDALSFKDEGDILGAAADPKACYRQDILPQKMAIQARYAQERSLGGDVKVLFRTLGALRGWYVNRWSVIYLKITYFQENKSTFWPFPVRVR